MDREEEGLWVLNSLGGRVGPLLGGSSTPREKATWGTVETGWGPERPWEGGHGQEPAEQSPSFLWGGLQNDSLGCPKKCDLEQVAFSKRVLSQYVAWRVLLLLDARERALGKAQLSRRPGVLEGPQGSVWRDMGWPPGYSRSKSGRVTRASPRVLNLQSLLPSWVGQQVARDKQEAMPRFL